MTEIPERLSAALAGRYTVERLVGRGGMATVYLARDHRHNRQVALKVLKPELAAVIGVDRFRREADVVANLQHPHILPLFESGEANGFVFFVMPYVEGESLRERLAREGALPLAEATRIMRQVADALAYAHSRGVVHRDIKPDNVMLSGRNAVVMDFGVARAVDQAADQAALTTTGMAVGTPAYMAPEQAVADPTVDHRADIYAFGVFAYELLAGKTPFADRTPQAMISAHVTETPPPLSGARPEVSRSLHDVVMRCLEKDRRRRWEHAEEIVDRLEALAETHETPSPTLSVRRRGWWPIAAAAIVTAAVAVTVGIWRGAPADDRTLSPTSLAVFPFRVQGNADLAYLGEGMVNLLATSMDGAGDLRSVDPRAVIARVERESGATIGPDEAADIAGGFGAGLYILGDIVQAGSRIRIDAALYDHRAGRGPAGSASVDGGPDELLPMVDRLASQLLRSSTIEAQSGVTRLASVTTSSLPALKHYLNAESAFRRSQFASAVEALQQAVAADSQFALAFYRLSVAAEWALFSDLAGWAAEQAVRYADRLAPHDRRLLEALRASRAGNPAEAERMFRAIVSVWPQDVEAWLELGEVQFHYAPFFGRSLAESADAFERVMALDPGHAPALMHLQRIAAREGDTAAVTSFDRQLAALQPDGERTFEVAVLTATVLDDSARLTDLRERLLTAPDVGVPQATFSAAIWTDADANLRPLIETGIHPSRSPVLRAVAHVHLASLDVQRGRWRSARDELAAAERANPAWGLEYRALMMLQPFLPVARADLETLRAQLERWDAEAVPASPIPTGHFASHDDLHPGLRLYLLGLANVALGRSAAAEVQARALAELDGTADARRLHTAFSRGLEGAAAEARGDLESAARILAGAAHLPEFYNPALFSPFRSLAADRFRLGRVLDSLDRRAEAAHIYGTFENFDAYDRIFAAPAHLRAGRLAERDGRPSDARRHYERVVFLWGVADPELQPAVEEARAALRRLAP